MQLAASPLRSRVESASYLLRGLSPPLVQQPCPLVDQLLPIYLDSRQGFSPSHKEARELSRNFYGEKNGPSDRAVREIVHVKRV
jgi:hypothetical protein